MTPLATPPAPGAPPSRPFLPSQSNPQPFVPGCNLGTPASSVVPVPGNWGGGGGCQAPLPAPPNTPPPPGTWAQASKPPLIWTSFLLLLSPQLFYYRSGKGFQGPRPGISHFTQEGKMDIWETSSPNLTPIPLYVAATLHPCTHRLCISTFRLLLKLAELDGAHGGIKKVPSLPTKAQLTPLANISFLFFFFFQAGREGGARALAGS